MERERKYYVSKHSVFGNKNVSLNKKLRRPFCVKLPGRRSLPDVLIDGSYGLIATVCGAGFVVCS